MFTAAICRLNDLCAFSLNYKSTETENHIFSTEHKADDSLPNAKEKSSFRLLIFINYLSIGFFGSGTKP